MKDDALAQQAHEWRKREVQAIGAAISTRSWHAVEQAYNSLRDKMDRAGCWHAPTPAPSIVTGSDERAREDEAVAAAPERNLCIGDWCDSCGWCVANKKCAREVRNIASAALAASRPTDAGADAPIPMILHCPRCHVQHIDEPTPEWDNPPHRSHLCLACGCIWRPADVPTAGVERIATVGSADTTLATPKSPVDEASFDIAYNGGYAAGAIGADKLRAATERFVDIVDRLGRGNNAIHDAIIEVRAALSARNLTGDGAGA